MIPKCSGEHAILPPGRHPATFEELYERFVVEAPWRDRRELIFRAVELFADIIRPKFSEVKFWLDGGFVTHKTWAEPEDADVVVIVPPGEYDVVGSDPAFAPLVTLQGVMSSQPAAMIPKLHPMGGLMDVFFQPDVDILLAPWDDLWSKVRGADGNEVPGVRKGYLEVVL